MRVRGQGKVMDLGKPFHSARSSFSLAQSLLLLNLKDFFCLKMDEDFIMVKETAETKH